ncbi:peptidoglycan DD-metalloendopeptidase family protein [Patescibacteria group bacterium]|nr:peptidoglycan DD-metalloendopeptidase family protein [Patescibacteria group bacterium]
MKTASPLLYVAVIATFLLLILSFRTIEGPGDLGLRSNVLSAFELSSKQAPAPETPELMFVAHNTLRAATPPLTITPQVLGAIMGQLEADIRPEVARYIVQKEDTTASVAEQFGVSLNTILWANDLSQSSTLKPGHELVILPTIGALHLVRPNDTLSEIASWYQAEVKEIVSFNALESSSAIFAGDFLIIPDGIQPSVLPQGRLTPLANSYFIYPVPSPYHITQGLHAFNAVDFSNGICGESVYAAAGGTVQRTGYTSLGGNYVRIIHPNGVVTYYGHLSAILTTPGTKVYQGQLVGYTGRTGYATGCHVHFEVRGAANPFR